MPSMTDSGSVRLTFRETSVFTRQITGLLSDDELNALQVDADGEAQPRLPHPRRRRTPQNPLGRLRRGKRGGLRVIYYWHVPGSTILFLFAYPKNEHDDLTPAQRNALKAIVQTEYP